MCPAVDRELGDIISGPPGVRAANETPDRAFDLATLGVLKRGFLLSVSSSHIALPNIWNPQRF